MKKTKKILALALAGMMAASALAGCSGSGGKEETQATTAPQTQAQETKAPETKKEEESSQAQETTDGGWEYKEATLSLLIDNNVSLDGLNAVCDLAKEKLGITIEIEYKVDDSVLKTRLASGEMTDLLVYNSGALLGALNPSEYFMDLSNEALESGQATIQGFINAAEDMLPDVQRAYNRLGVAAASALSSVGGGSVSLDLLGSPTPHYASGTNSAEPGFALVGEEGPELVYFNGGEKVINASETASMRTSPGISAMATPYGSGDSPVTIQLSINIQGNATPETVEALQAQSEDIARLVQEAMLNMMADQKRRAMA